MSLEAREPKKRTGDRGRTPYRFTAAQVLKMVHLGIIKEDVELWDGVIYKMTKKELHNYLVSQAADGFRRVTPRDRFDVREEKASRDSDDTLPEPDVTVARGPRIRPDPKLPTLEQLALVVEVDHHSARTDRVVKFNRYADREVPVYWIILARRREVLVFDMPEGHGVDAHYARRRAFSEGQEIPIVLDGDEVGRVPVDEIFPPRTPNQERP